MALMEALVAILLLSICALAYAGLQLRGLSANSSSMWRSKATMLAYEMADRMRANRSAVTGVSTPNATLGQHRLAINALQFPLGYDGGRFNVVPHAQRAVFYVCSGASATLDGNGNAPGVLYRRKNYGFNAAVPASCPSIVGADVLATGLRSCRFVYTANQGATQQSGFLQVQLEFTRNSETSSLVFGAHVVNMP